MRPSALPKLGATLATFLCLASGSPAVAQEPGVSVASPRFAISLVDDFLIFRPSRLVLEQGDWVRWRHIGTFMLHTTTSTGLPCSPSGLWNASLGPGQLFTRRFVEAPQTFPYYCTPHCINGMTGSVVVTSLINVTASGGASVQLSWTGGGGVYRIVRSAAASFGTVADVTLAPDQGDAATTFTDATLPSAGGVLYYLVMNKF